MAREYTREIYLYINGQQINNDIKSIRAEMQSLINEQAKMVVGCKEYVAAGEKIRLLKGIMNEHTLQLKNMDQTWKQSMNAMGDWFNRFQAFGFAVAAGIVGVVAAFRQTTQASMLMEERLSNLSALTGLTGHNLDWLGQRSKDLSVSITETGVRIKQSATDIVDAYTKVGSQRPELLKNKESLTKVTEAAIILSEAAKSKLEPATLALTTTMNQFNLGAREVDRIINVLGAGALVGAGEIPYLTEVMEKSGTTANLMGLSIEQMTGIIEGVAPKFQQAEVAGTMLDRVFLELRKRNIGYKDGIFDINRAIDELSARYKAGQSSVDIFGVRQAKMGEILVMNQDKINEYTKAVTGTHVAFEQAGKNTDNMAARLAQAKNKVTLMYIEVGEKLAPALVFSTNALNIFLRSMMALPKILSDNRVLLTSLVGAVLAYNAALITQAATSLWNRAALLLTIKSESLQILMNEALAASCYKLNFAQKAAVVTQWLWNAAMDANPLGVAIATITAMTAAFMVYDKNSKESLATEASKKALIDELATSNGELSASYSMLSEDQDHLNRMSLAQKKELADQLDATIRLAEANYDLQKSKRGEIRAESSKITGWQFLTTWSASGKLEKARENGVKAVEDIDKALQKSADTIQGMKDQKNTLNDILFAEKDADKIGMESISMMEEKLSLYKLALDNAKIGTADYIRLVKKVAEVDAALKKARGSDLSGDDDKFKRKEALADIETYHNQVNTIIKAQYAEGLIDKDQYLMDLDKEDVRYQTAAIVRLRKFHQDTSAEEEKLEGTLVSIKDAGIKETEKAAKDLQDKYDDFYKEWDKESIQFLKDAGEYYKLPFAGAEAILEEDYRMKTTLEGQRDKIRKDHFDLHIIGETEMYDKLDELDKKAAEKKMQRMEDWARAASMTFDAVGNMWEAAKNKELSVAGLTDKEKQKIELKYAKRQQALAETQAIIEGVLEIAKINSNTGVNADLTQTLRAVLTGAAVLRTAANVALIESQQFSRGRYPVKGASDGRIYQASMMGTVKTGYYSKPTLGLFSEREPEIVIDGPTTRNIKANFPGILRAINSARVNQFAGGMYPEIGSSQQAIPVELRDLLIANYRMMQEVRDSHQRPALVSFQSLRDRQGEFDSIKSRTTIG